MKSWLSKKSLIPQDTEILKCIYVYAYAYVCFISFLKFNQSSYITKIKLCQGILNTSVKTVFKQYTPLSFKTVVVSKDGYNQCSPYMLIPFLFPLNMGWTDLSTPSGQKNAQM